MVFIAFDCSIDLQKSASQENILSYALINELHNEIKFINLSIKTFIMYAIRLDDSKTKCWPICSVFPNLRTDKAEHISIMQQEKEEKKKTNENSNKSMEGFFPRGIGMDCVLIWTRKNQCGVEQKKKKNENKNM